MATAFIYKKKWNVDPKTTEQLKNRNYCEVNGRKVVSQEWVFNAEGLIIGGWFEVEV